MSAGLSKRGAAAVLAALLVLTAAEVGLAAAGARGGLMLALLLAMSFGKAVLIGGWFMHLRYERRAFVWTLIPAALACILLLCFVLPDSSRARAVPAQPAGSGDSR